MNEQTEEIFNQMFAPEPVPDAVKKLFDRTNFLANRIDAQMFRPAELAIIAGVAAQSIPTSKPKVAQPTSEDVPIDTSEPTTHPERPPGGAPDVPITEPPPDAEPTTAPTGGRTGPMDAAPTPDKKRRGLAATKMQKLTVRELKVHAQQVYGWKPPTSYKKPEIIAVLKTKKPIGT